MLKAGDVMKRLEDNGLVVTGELMNEVDEFCGVSIRYNRPQYESSLVAKFIENKLTNKTGNE